MTAKPEILRGVQGHCEVRFTYEFKGGESGYVSGNFSRALGSEEAGITGIEVKVDAVRSKLPAGTEVPADGLVKFAVARITPGESGLIVPVSKKEQAAVSAGLPVTDKQVAYALSLCNRDGEPGAGNFYRPSAAEFRAMDRTEISAWIDMAKFEMSI
jgi:hypothetical protein